MATFYLINTTVIEAGGVMSKHFAGELVDDAKVDAARIRSAGGVLWPSATAVIATAGALAQSLHKNKGASELTCDAIMMAAVASQLNSVDEVTLAAVVAAQATDATNIATNTTNIATAAAQLALLPARVQTGTLTLSSGTKTLNTGITITAGSKVYVSLNTPSGAAIGVQYKVPDAGLVVGAPSTGAFAVTAVDATGSTVATDVSTLNYLIVG